MAKMAATIPWPHGKNGGSDSMAAMAKSNSMIAWPKWPHVPWSHGQIGRNDSVAAANPWPPWFSRVP